MPVLCKLLFLVIGIKLTKLFQLNPGITILVALAAGHIADKILFRRFERWRWGKKFRKQAKQQMDEAFLVSAFSMFAKLCMIDGAVQPEEITKVQHYMDEVFNLNRRSKQRAKQVFRHARKNPLSFQRHAVEFYNICAHDSVTLESMLHMLLGLALADGNLKQEEFRLISATAAVFDMPHESFVQLCRHYGVALDQENTEQKQANGQQQFSSQAVDPVSQGYKTLGCQPEDSDATIKKAYRKLVSEYHPDKIVSKELPKDFVEFANEKFKRIQEAYDTLKIDRGLS